MYVMKLKKAGKVEGGRGGPEISGYTIGTHHCKDTDACSLDREDWAEKKKCDRERQMTNEERAAPAGVERTYSVLLSRSGYQVASGVA